MAISYRGVKEMAEMEKRKRPSFEDWVDRLLGIMTVVGVGALTILIVTGCVFGIVSLVRWLMGN